MISVNIQTKILFKLKEVTVFSQYILCKITNQGVNLNCRYLLFINKKNMFKLTEITVFTQNILCKITNQDVNFNYSYFL